MVRAATTVDVSGLPEVARLAEEVRRTRRPRVLQRDGKDIALLVPVPATPHRRVRRPLSRRYSTIASLAGAAGSLPQAMSWKEVQDVVREERAAAYRAKHQ